MEKASAESGFDPSAKARHSSARGLYQFISDTWLHMVKNYGDKFGLGQYADQIEIKNGKACVSDCKVRDAILNLRNDPEISALMAGAYSAENKAYLRAHTQGKVGAAELSIAHFMGAGGAAKFLNARAQDGDAIAAAAFPREAKLNRGVFYDKDGSPRSFNEIYNFFEHKFTGGTHGAARAAAASPATAPVASARSGTSMHSLNTVTGAQALSSFDDTTVPHLAWTGSMGGARQASSGFSHRKTGDQKLSSSMILTLAEMSHARASAVDRHGYNS